jgi:hypothetical protein
MIEFLERHQSSDEIAEKEKAAKEKLEREQKRAERKRKHAAAAAAAAAAAGEDDIVGVDAADAEPDAGEEPEILRAEEIPDAKADDDMEVIDGDGARTTVPLPLMETAIRGLSTAVEVVEPLGYLLSERYLSGTYVRWVLLLSCHAPRRGRERHVTWSFRSVGVSCIQRVVPFMSDDAFIRVISGLLSSQRKKLPVRGRGPRCPQRCNRADTALRCVGDR